MTDEQYMQQALDLAKKAASEGEVPVGAVIVKTATGEIVGRGRNRREAARHALSHAELEAIDEACKTLGGWRLAGCTLYVTLEPCPMCAGAIINARLDRVVYGAHDPKAGSCGSLVDLFSVPYNHHPALTTGVCEEVCAGELRMFFKKLREKRKNTPPDDAHTYPGDADVNRIKEGVMRFQKSSSIKIRVSPEQEKQLSSNEKIAANITEKNVLAFDIYTDKTLVGFVMLRQFDNGCYFLWNFAIDIRFQNRHYGTRALSELLAMLKEKSGMHTVTVTYKFGNEHAKHLYEKAGFTETDIVNEDGCHEVNMIYHG